MAHHEDERTPMHGVLDMLIEKGLEGMADAMATMLNEAMKIERSSALVSVSATPTVSSRRGCRVERGCSISRFHKFDPCPEGPLLSFIRKVSSEASEANEP